MKIEVLGPGCKRCEQLYENTLSAASDFDPSTGIEVEKVTDINYFHKAVHNAYTPDPIPQFSCSNLPC
ncbi:MAG: thioredoxin family protein, partial [Desulfobacterales bacterium]|nr:thioredoxin family protein [Desulfobacterales bacterium]